MEVEVKLLLPNEETHNRLKSILSPHHLRTETQQNHFFDTTLSTLSSNRAVLRIRFVNNDHRCVLSLKAKPVLVNGVSRVEEDEEEIDPKTGRQCVSEPVKLQSLTESRVIKRCLEEFGVGGEVGFVCLGGFENVREVYAWKNGLKLEVDKTTYGFGVVCYELECECESSGDIEGVKGEIEGFLKDNGIEFKDSEMSKFAVFRSGKLPS